MSTLNSSIILDNDWIIYNIASKYRGYYSMEDLYQVGSIGLIKAYKKFNVNSNTKFSTYAYKYVLGEIIDFIKSDRNIKVSEEYMEIYRRYNNVRELLTSKYNRDVSFNEICSFMQIDETYMLHIIEMISFTLSSNDLLYEESCDERDEVFNKILIESELNSLDEFDRRIIDYRYFKDFTQSETADIMGISQVKVSRTENMILQRLKSRVA